MIELFVIYGGKQNFMQWDLNQLVTNPCMKEGDEVVFYNSHGATYVVNAFEQDGEILADVPNYLLQTEGNILVDLGQGLERHTECRTTFAVVAQAEPEGYDCQYNVPDRPAKAVGGVSSWNDLTDKPDTLAYVEEGGMVEILPECQPTYSEGDGGFVAAPTSIPMGGDTCIVNWNGAEYTCVAQDCSAMMPGAVLLGDGANLGISGGSGEPFAIVIFNQDGQNICMCIPFDGTTELTISIKTINIAIHKLDNRCLDLAWLPTVVDGAETVLSTRTLNTQITTVTDFVWAVDCVGKTYIVEYGGERYECVCGSLSADGQTVNYIGNQNLHGNTPEADTGEPFCIQLLEGVTYIFKTGSSAEITVYGPGYNKMPEGFLPDGLFVDGAESLVLTSAEDTNGIRHKFRISVNGSGQLITTEVTE